MKITLTFLVFSILFLFSCKDTSLESSEEYQIEVEVSEFPIVLNNDCLAKSIYTKLKGKKFDLDLEVEVRLDTTYLISEVFKGNKNGMRIDLPENGNYKMLIILVKKGKDVLTERVIPIKYVQTNDIVEFVKYNIYDGKPIHLMERKCWPNYKGGHIPKGKDWEFIANKVVSTKVIGENFTRTFTIKDTRLNDHVAKENIFITPEINYTFSGKNYLNFKDGTESSSTENENARILQSKNGLASQNNIKNQYSGSFSIRMETDGKTRPSYMVIGCEQGTYLKAKVLDCNRFDTLAFEQIIIPEYIQLEVTCKD